jgi:hypothetical protein
MKVLELGFFNSDESMLGQFVARPATVRACLSSVIIASAAGNNK